MQPLGETVLDVYNPVTKLTTSVPFIVVENQFNCLLCLNTIIQMNMITVNDKTFIANMNSADDKPIDATIMTDTVP